VLLVLLLELGCGSVIGSRSIWTNFDASVLVSLVELLTTSVLVSSDVADSNVSQLLVCVELTTLWKQILSKVTRCEKVKGNGEERRVPVNMVGDAVGAG
jgi:hypothetical protein